MRDFAFVRDQSTTLGGLIAMSQQPVISDLMSLAARHNSFTLSLQSTISTEGCSPDILSVETALHLEAELMTYLRDLALEYRSSDLVRSYG